MGPKKKKPADKKKGPEDEYVGPNIYLEVKEKHPQDIATDLQQPIPRMNTENEEFEKLEKRIQNDIRRLNADNSRLKRKLGISEKDVGVEHTTHETKQFNSVRERNAAAEHKDKLLQDYTEINDNLQFQQEDFCKHPSPNPLIRGVTEKNN